MADCFVLAMTIKKIPATNRDSFIALSFRTERNLCHCEGEFFVSPEAILIGYSKKIRLLPTFISLRWASVPR